MSEQHTKEPWKLGDCIKIPSVPDSLAIVSDDVAIGQRTSIVALLAPLDSAKLIDHANGRRIVACVNALAGIEDPAAFVAAVKALAVESLESDEAIDRQDGYVEMIRERWQALRNTLPKRDINGDPMPASPPPVSQEQRGEVSEAASREAWCKIARTCGMREDDLQRLIDDAAVLDLLTRVQMADRRSTADAARLATLTEEVRVLRGVVDKVPKTADGVPIVPGMELWHPAQIGRAAIYPSCEGDYWLVDVPTRLGRDNFVDRSHNADATECYSTEAAALAASSVPTQADTDGGPQNYTPNTVEWQPGDFVLHDFDVKSPNMLMRVTGYSPDGLCETVYFDPPISRGNGTRRNRVCMLHDPRRFGVELPGESKGGA